MIFWGAGLYFVLQLMATFIVRCDNTTNGATMPKVLCITSLAISGLLAVLFLVDLASGFPFGKAGGILVNLTFIASAAGLGAHSYFTLREQR